VAFFFFLVPAISISKVAIIAKVLLAVNPTTQVMDKRISLPIAFFCEINRNGGYVAGSIQSIQESSLHQTSLAEALFSIIA
jgi:hypothetical protein